MAKVRYDSKNDPVLNGFLWEGTPEELLFIYDGLKKRLENVQLVNKQDNVVLSHISPAQVVHILPRTLRYRTEVVELAKSMPTVDQLVSYILSKPRFEHDIVDVGLKFFGKQIASRKYGSVYRELRAKLQEARNIIESSHKGAFERRTTSPRNLQVYTFKPINSVLFGQPVEKPS